jgi:NitT/TauT family transport system permease protein
MRRARRSGPEFLRGYAFVALLAALWAGVCASGAVPEGQLPSPYEVLRALLAEGPRLPAQAFATLSRTLLAFFLGALGGLGLGLGHGVFPVFRKTTNAAIEGLRPLPSVALIPLGILLYGMGDPLNVAIAAFACAWPCFISARDGVRGVSPLLLDTALTLGFGRAKTLWSVILPAAFPAMVTGLRIALGVAFAVEVSVELVVPRQGLGALASTAALAGEGGLLYAAILATGLVGLLLNHLLRRATQRLLRPYGPQWSGGA